MICEPCSYSTDDNDLFQCHLWSADHRRVLTRQSFYCSVCKIHLCNKVNLTNHLLTKAHAKVLAPPPERTQCPKCSFTTKYKYNLPKHMLSHMD